MGKYVIAAIVLGAALVLVACQQQDQALPTLAPTLADISEATVEATQIPPTPIPAERPTLPPTWTPAVLPTQTPVPATPTLTQDEESRLMPPTPLEVCNTFGEDLQRNSRTFQPGEPATVYWTSVAGALSYYIKLIDQEGEEVFADYSAQPSYTFSADLLEPEKLYGWEVYPIDALNQQMCTTRGAELFPAPPQ